MKKYEDADYAWAIDKLDLKRIDWSRLPHRDVNWLRSKIHYFSVGFSQGLPPPVVASMVSDAVKNFRFPCETVCEDGITVRGDGSFCTQRQVIFRGVVD